MAAIEEPEVGGSGQTVKPWVSDGREALAAAVRRLTTGTVTSLAPPDLLADVARRASSLADELEHFVPEEGPEPFARLPIKRADPTP